MDSTAVARGLMTVLLLQISGAQPRATPPTADRQILPRGTLTVFGIVVNKPHFSIFVISVVLVSLFGILLRRSWLGLGVRAAGQLPDVSRLRGVSPVAVSRFNWALSGLLAGLAGVLIGPVTVVNAGTFSFLLVKAVGATLMGGLVSLPLTFVGGIGIGVVEALAPHFWKTPGAAAVAVAALIFVMLRMHGKRFALLGYAGTVHNTRVSGPVAVGIATWLNTVRRLADRVPKPLWALLAVPALL